MNERKWTFFVIALFTVLGFILAWMIKIQQTLELILKATE